MKAPRHFLDLDAVGGKAVRAIIAEARARKAARAGGRAQARADADRPLDGRLLALVFEKPSTRTRVSFDVGMRQLGGQALVLNAAEAQWSRGESVGDTARVLSRYVDAAVLRVGSHRQLGDFAAQASVPVVNGLTQRSHPCQIVADIMTFEEHRGAIGDRTIAWIGDGNNVAASWIQAAGVLGFRLRLGCPPGARPDAGIVAAAGDRVSVVEDPRAAVRGAACVVTDVWSSVNDSPQEAAGKRAALSAYRVTAGLMAEAAPEALFMHCLPAHRGEEVAAEVADGPQSVIFDEAENRLHAQKAILLWCFEVLPGG